MAPKVITFPIGWPFTLNLWMCPQKIFWSSQICKLLLMTVTSCIYAILLPNPPVCQNWGEGPGVKQILAMRKRLLMKLAPKHIHYTQRPTVVLWEGRYITPHQLYQVGKYWWSFFQVNTTNMNNKCLPAWFYQMNYCRIPNALRCL